MRATNSFVALVTVLCTVAACTMANADIDKSTVEAGRVHIQGKIDTSQDLVVRIDRGDKPIESRSSRTAGGEFEVVVEVSDKIRLEGGKTGHGFVVTTKILTSSDITYVACGGDFAGTFAIRREADFVTKDGVLTFADVTLKDGKKLPVSLRLALSRIAAPVRADEKAAEAKAQAIKELIPELPRVEDLLVGPFLSNIQQPITFSQGFRFRFPYDGGGAMKTFLLDRPDHIFLWPPKVDASTTEGRKAIFQTLRDAHEGPHFTMDGKQLLALNNARIVPFRFKDERLRKSWIDAIRRIPPALLVESIKKRHAAAKNTAGPVERSYVLPLTETSFFAALTSDDRPVILWITRRTEEFQYDVSHYLLEPVPHAKKPLDKQAGDDEDKAVEAITKLGGTITRDEQAVGKPVIAASFEHTGVTSEGLTELKELKHLQSLNLNRYYRITDAALLEIAEIKSLRSLDLGFTGLQTDTAVNAGHLGESIFVTLVFRMGLNPAP